LLLLCLLLLLLLLVVVPRAKPQSHDTGIVNELIKEHGIPRPSKTSQ